MQSFAADTEADDLITGHYSDSVPTACARSGC
jgi:hypothetical protein